MSIDEILIQFNQVTNELLAIDIDEDTDEIIILVELLLSQRDQIIDKIKEHPIELPKEQLNRMLQRESEIGSKFGELMLILGKKLETIKIEKKQSSVKKKAYKGYMNLGYQNDGYFIDKKK